MTEDNNENKVKKEPETSENSWFSFCLHQALYQMTRVKWKEDSVRDSIVWRDIQRGVWIIKNT